VPSTSPGEDDGLFGAATAGGAAWAVGRTTTGNHTHELIEHYG